MITSFEKAIVTICILLIIAVLIFLLDRQTKDSKRIDALESTNKENSND